MGILWQKIRYGRVHPAQILTVVAVGMVVGVLVMMVSGLRIFATPLCLILAIALWVWAAMHPAYACVLVAIVAGFLMGAWRGSNYLLGAGAGKAEYERDVLTVVREGYAEGIRQNIEGEESALGLSYLLGMKDELTEEMNDALRAVGLTHIVVASGTHLSILVEMTRKIFGKISKAAGAIFGILLIVVFATMIGWTPSIARAAIVSILALTMGYVGRKFQPLRLIILAMAITLMINPANITALGWQLSFAAYAGIMLLLPILKRIFYGDGETKPGRWGELLLASVSATALCLPLQLYYFGELSLIALPANLLILPTIPYAMGLTFLAGAGGLLSPLGRLAGILARWLLAGHLLVVRFLAEQTMFLVMVPPYQAWTLWIYAPILLVLLLGRWRRASWRGD